MSPRWFYIYDMSCKSSKFYLHSQLRYVLNSIQSCCFLPVGLPETKELEGGRGHWGKVLGPYHTDDGITFLSGVTTYNSQLYHSRSLFSPFQLKASEIRQWAPNKMLHRRTVVIWHWSLLSSLLYPDKLEARRSMTPTEVQILKRNDFSLLTMMFKASLSFLLHSGIEQWIGTSWHFCLL